jgi:quinol monooxygenase YgiN
MIHVIAEVTLADGTREEFLREFHAIVPTVRDEDGCLEYGPTVDFETGIAAQEPSRENVATIIEKWESVDALEAHLNAPHMVEYRKKVKDLVLDLKLTILKPA